MATRSVGRKAPARAPVAPTTTTPATPEAAQAQAVALLKEASTLLGDAIGSPRSTPAMRLAGIGFDIAGRMLKALETPADDGVACELETEALDLGTVAACVVGLEPKGAPAKACVRVSRIGDDVADLLNRTDWPEAVKQPEPVDTTVVDERTAGNILQALSLKLCKASALLSVGAAEGAMHLEDFDTDHLCWYLWAIKDLTDDCIKISDRIKTASIRVEEAAA